MDRIQQKPNSNKKLQSFKITTTTTYEAKMNGMQNRILQYYIDIRLQHNNKTITENNQFKNNVQ